jgi:hypothetical protein
MEGGHMSAEEFFSEQVADRRHGRPVQPQQWIVRVELDGVAATVGGSR